MGIAATPHYLSNLLSSTSTLSLQLYFPASQSDVTEFIQSGLELTSDQK
jgi:hypothetical protein